MQAPDFLKAGIKHMQDRASTYDKPEGERSMSATVAAFNAVTGDGVMNTEERGWLFMQLLKAVRSQQGEFRADSYEDGASYSGLAGEAAYKDRGPGKKTENWPAAADDRMLPIMQNGNEGEHYQNSDEWFEHDRGGCPVPPDTYVDVRLRDGRKLWSTNAIQHTWNHSADMPEDFQITHYRIAIKRADE